MQFYQIQSVLSGLCISQPGGSDSLTTKPGDKIILASQTGSLEQAISLKGVNYSGGHAYEIRFFQNFVADIPASQTANGVNVQFWTEKEGANQLWTFIPINNILYIYNAHSGLVLDIPAFEKTAGGNIQQWKWNGGANQQWQIWPNLGLSNFNHTFEVLTLEREARGTQFRFIGSGFEPNSLLKSWYLGAPGIVLTSAWSGDAIRVDAGGNFQTDALVLFSIEGAGQHGGNALCVLEDAQGYISAIAVFPAAALAG